MKKDDWNDVGKIEDVFYKEVEEEIKKRTGGTRVFIFDHSESENGRERVKD